ncbi:unnamed protein product [Angiostrongylus costaricensis]|uniref:Uncharacterized protein n=1 Tax=Angiostrongylus costaricensis TaxID=334426 RepID=A0A0R3PV11_ANGCS|nr:unnamed protein product [Angiostrongylus costaricensis]
MIILIAIIMINSNNICYNTNIDTIIIPPNGLLPHRDWEVFLGVELRCTAGDSSARRVSQAEKESGVSNRKPS